MPATSDRVEFSADEVGITLNTDEKTLQEIDQIHEEALKAGQANKKFAWR